jgi:mono/diheme cytochrome c family protein
MGRSTLATAVVVAAAALTVAGCSDPDEGTPPSTGPATTSATPGPPGDVAAGKTVFLGVSGCGGCHALADAGSTSSVASDLDEKEPSEARVRMFVIEGKGAMPAYGEQLNEQEIADVAAYVAAVAGR